MCGVMVTAVITTPHRTVFPVPDRKSFCRYIYRLVILSLTPNQRITTLLACSPFGPRSTLNSTS